MRGWWLAALAAASSCGPALHTLVAGGHLREVVCAGQEEVAGASEALAAQTGTVALVQVVPDELVAQRGGSATATYVRLVRVQVSTNALPVDAMAVQARLLGSGGPAPATWATLSSNTGEALPAPHTSTTINTESNVAGVVLSIVTGGLAAFFWPWESKVITSPPTELEYARLAPRAAALRDGLGKPECYAVSPDGVGKRCTFAFVVDRRATGPFTLEVDAALEAARDSTSESRCRVTTTSSVTLDSLDSVPVKWLPLQVSERR